MYVSGYVSNQVFGFVADPASGALTPVQGPPPTIPGQPGVLVGDPVRRSVYVSAIFTSPYALRRFNIDPATGTLQATPPVALPGLPEQGGALHPQLPIFYMTDPLFEKVRAYRVNEPCCIVEAGIAPGWNNVHGADVHPTGRFLYTTTTIDNIAGNSSHLWGYAIDAGTGVPTPLPGSPWFDSVGKVTTNLKVEASGRFVYAVHRAAAEITGFAIVPASGALTPLPGSPFSTAGVSEYLTITESGLFLYTTHPTMDLVSGFAIGPTGQLTPVPGSPFAVGHGPQGLVTGGLDRFLYVAGQFNAIWAYAIDGVTGTLTPLAGQPFPSAGWGGRMTRVRLPSPDPEPALSVDDASVTEGDAGFVDATFTVRLANPPPAGGVTVAFATSPGTASAPADYTATSGTLTFPAGVDTRQVSVPVAGDVLEEPDEFFALLLSSPAGAVVARSEAHARIRDDDGAPILLSALDRNADVIADLQAQPGPAPDEDLYLLHREPWTSHEVVVDGASGDLGDAGPLVELVSGDFSTVMPSSPVGTGPARTLRLENDQAAARLDYVRVRSLGCSSDCGPDDTYRIRVRETTGLVPRFNETGGQTTVLMLQNLSAASLTAHVSYWGASGARLAGTNVTLAPRGSAVLPTPPPAQGTSGSVTVSHDGSLGALAGKAVALDPATGLSFDTPLVVRPR